MKRHAAIVLAALLLSFPVKEAFPMGARPAAMPRTVKIYDAEKDSVVEVPTVVRTDAEWKKVLTPEQYEVTANKGTELPGTCTFTNIKEEGLYKCVRCGTDLFRTGTKFESGTGWPSFFEPVSSLNILERPDNSLGMVRTEVLCARCGAHLGHVFNDGPPPTGRRYCINGVALRFVPKKLKPALMKAAFAAGCFWHVQEEFDKVKGVVSTTVGYSGGSTKDPTYEKVCSDTTGHAETVFIEYDPSVVTYEKLLDVFWSIHDPTQLDRQGPDIGSQYRSAIFYFDEAQKDAAVASRDRIESSGRYKGKIVTIIEPVSGFYKAEEYHQKYFEKNR